MKYKAKRGIALTDIGGKPFLVSAWALRNELPYVTEVNETTAICWERLVEGSAEEDLIRLVLEEFEVENETLIRDDIRCLLGQLRDGGYIEIC